MNKFLKETVVKLLKDTASKIDAETCEMTEQQAMDIMSVLSHEAMSKDAACSYVNLSRSRFDELVKRGKIPKGRKRRGFKELIWWKDELDTCKSF